MFSHLLESRARAQEDECHNHELCLSSSFPWAFITEHKPYSMESHPFVSVGQLFQVYFPLKPYPHSTYLMEGWGAERKGKTPILCKQCSSIATNTGVLQHFQPQIQTAGGHGLLWRNINSTPGRPNTLHFVVNTFEHQTGFWLNKHWQNNVEQFSFLSPSTPGLRILDFSLFLAAGFSSNL